MTSPRIMRLSSLDDFVRFKAGTLMHNRGTGELADPRDWDFAIIGSVYESAPWDLFQRLQDQTWQYHGGHADEVYALQHAHKLWPHWGRAMTLVEVGSDRNRPGRWTCIRCGRDSDDIPARFEGDYELPICEKCT